MTLALPPALPGTRHTLTAGGRTVSVYAATPADPSAQGATPLLLVHSVNAAASAYEVKPLYDHYRAGRPVFALELPGYGFSERRDAPYTPRLMTDAVHAALQDVVARCGRSPDLLALSLSCEFAARAVVERPESAATLALVSPTGFSRRTPSPSPRLRAFLRFPLWDRALFRGLTTRTSIRYFLRRTYGAPQVDEGMVAYDHATARQPGARFAPYWFVSGALFSPDILDVYRQLELPVWMVHGMRGDFVDYSRKTAVESRPNWQIDVYPTGALPHFELPADFCRDYDHFRAASARP